MGDSGEERADNYLLSRVGLASARLTAQHHVLTERQGWMLHPDIEKSIAGKDDITMADVATGNGIWALNLSKSHPTAKIVGLDISSDQFPPAFTLPDNVSLDYLNLLEPIPEKFHNTFDVVHIRLIVGFIYNKDKDMVLSNVLSMLKPGGYLQWDDVCNYALMIVDRSLQKDTRPRPYLDRIDKVAGVYKATFYVNELPHEFERKGMDDVLIYDPPSTR